jgi:hypothetical protein
MFQNVVATHKVEACVGERKFLTIHALLKKFGRRRDAIQQTALCANQIHHGNPRITGLLLMTQRLGQIEQKLGFATTDVQQPKLRFVATLTPTPESGRGHQPRHIVDIATVSDIFVMETLIKFAFDLHERIMFRQLPLCRQRYYHGDHALTAKS